MSINTDTIDNSYLLFVRSKEVDQITTGFNSDMNINLEAQISRNNALQDIHIQLSSCEIPISFYNFSSNLNNINLFVDGVSSLVLTEQNYSIDEMIDEITASSFPYSATINYQKAKITLTNTDATSHTINFSETSSKNLAKALGFNRTDVVVGSGGSITSDDVINLNTIHSIFIHTNLPVTNVITTTNNNYRNIIQKIPVTKSFGDVLNYNPYQSSLFSTILNINQINAFRISLRDQNDNLIQFNDVNFEISFLFEIHMPSNIETNLTGSEAPISGRRRGIPTIITQTTTQPTSVGQTKIITPATNNTSIQQKKSIPVQQLGFFSQPKKTPNIEMNIPSSNLEEDKLLDDNFQHEIQSKILEAKLETLEDII
jgi:hypothetical protein